MNVSISKKEYEAIGFAIAQIRDAIEGASNEEYIKDESIAEKALYNIMSKYQKARVNQEYYSKEYAKIKAIMKAHPFETRGLKPSQVKNLIYRGKRV